MNVLIWGGDSWANRGDDAVLAGTLVALRAKVSGARIIVASNKPSETSTRHGVKAVGRASPGILWALIQADVVIWGGGLLIQNQSSKPFLIVQLLFVSMALLLRKQVVCYGQGVGPVRGRLFQLALRFVLRRLTAVTVRDRASARRLRALGVQVDVLADPSFCIEALDTPTRAPFIAVALRRWGHYRGGWLPVRWAQPEISEDFEAFCREVAAALDQLPAQVLFIPMCPGGDQGDDEVAEQVRGMMRRPASMLREPLSAAQLKGLLGQAEMVIAMRTHAAVLAAGVGTPVLSISYQGKGRAFMSGLGLMAYCVPWQQVTSRRLVQLSRRLWQDQEAVRARLRQQATEMRAKAFRNAELVAGLPWTDLYAGRGRLAPLVQERRRVSLDLLAAAPGERVLDLGCGVGAYRGAVRQQGAQWIGVDRYVAQALLPASTGESACAPLLLRADLRALPVACGAACAALAVGVLDYLPPENLRPALEEMSRVLHPGGRAVVSYNGRWWGGVLRDRLPWAGVRRGSLYDHTDGIREGLAAAGLTVERRVRVRGGRCSPDTTLLSVRKPAGSGGQAPALREAPQA